MLFKNKKNYLFKYHLNLKNNRLKIIISKIKKKIKDNLLMQQIHLKVHKFNKKNRQNCRKIQI